MTRLSRQQGLFQVLKSLTSLPHHYYPQLSQQVSSAIIFTEQHSWQSSMDGFSGSWPEHGPNRDTLAAARETQFTEVGEDINININIKI